MEENHNVLIAHAGNVDEMVKSPFQPQGPDALTYWITYKNNFSKIAPILPYISKMPASSSSLERIFSEISRKGWVSAPIQVNPYLYD